VKRRACPFMNVAKEDDQIASVAECCSACLCSPLLAKVPLTQVPTSETGDLSAACACRFFRPVACPALPHCSHSSQLTVSSTELLLPKLRTCCAPQRRLLVSLFHHPLSCKENAK
jgi:hypothetical protein